MNKETIKDLRLALISFKAKFVTVFESRTPQQEYDAEIEKIGAIIDRNLTSIEKQLKKL